MSKKLLIFPEDAATRDLILGFKKSGRFCDSTTHIGTPGGGKFPTICQLADWMPDLRRYPDRKVLFVLDSDSREGTVTTIWQSISKVVEDSLNPCFRDAAPERLSKERQHILNRIFLFSWHNEVEDLKQSAMGQGRMTALGQKLASEMERDSCVGSWQNRVFQSTLFSAGSSGQTECERIREGIFPLIFA